MILVTATAAAAAATTTTAGYVVERNIINLYYWTISSNYFIAINLVVVVITIIKIPLNLICLIIRCLQYFVPLATCYHNLLLYSYHFHLAPPGFHLFLFLLIIQHHYYCYCCCCCCYYFHLVHCFNLNDPPLDLYLFQLVQFFIIIKLRFMIIIMAAIVRGFAIINLLFMNYPLINLRLIIKTLTKVNLPILMATQNSFIN